MVASKRRWIALASIIVIVAGLAGSMFFFYDYFLPESIAEIDQELPILTLQDMEGQPVSLNSYPGKPLLACFIQVNCHHCQNQLLVLETLHQEIPDDDLEVLVISASPLEETADFFFHHPTLFPIWIDANRNLYKKLGVFNVPALFLVDKLGILRHKAVGYQSIDAVRGIVDSLLKSP